MMSIKTIICCFCFISLSVQATTFTLFTEELPPYAMKEKGKPTGASVDIVSELFKRVGLDFNVRIVPWKRAYLTTLEEANACIFPVQRNQEREVLFHWVSPILITQTGFYTNASASHDLRTMNDVKGLRVGSYKGSAAAEYLTGQGFKMSLITRDAPNIQKLQAKRIDVWAADTLMAGHMMKERSVTDVNESLIYFTTLRALACNLDTPLETIDKLSSTLKQMYTEGVVEKIKAKYR